MDGGTQSGRSRSWLVAALRSGSLSMLQSVIVYVAFQASACVCACAWVGAWVGVRVFVFHGRAEGSAWFAASFGGHSLQFPRASPLTTGMKPRLGSRAHLQVPLSLRGVRAMLIICTPPLPVAQVQADEVADRLKQAGISAAAYHAGKHMDERLRVQVRCCVCARAWHGIGQGVLISLLVGALVWSSTYAS